MALETKILEFPFVQGQNEGTDRAVLSPPQLAYVQNARYRKGQRLGKRHGYTSVFPASDKEETMLEWR